MRADEDDEELVSKLIISNVEASDFACRSGPIRGRHKQLLGMRWSWLSYCGPCQHEVTKCTTKSVV